MHVITSVLLASVRFGIWSVFVAACVWTGGMQLAGFLFCGHEYYDSVVRSDDKRYGAQKGSFTCALSAAEPYVYLTDFHLGPTILFPHEAGVLAGVRYPARLTWRNNTVLELHYEQCVDSARGWHEVLDIYAANYDLFRSPFGSTSNPGWRGLTVVSDCQLADAP